MFVSAEVQALSLRVALVDSLHVRGALSCAGASFGGKVDPLSDFKDFPVKDVQYLLCSSPWQVHVLRLSS